MALQEHVVDVAVIGFGPSGAVAAGLLGQAGLRTYVCDRQHGVYDKPRAISLDHEIMRVFQQLGITGEIAPHVEPFTPSEYFGVDGQLIRRMTMVAPPYPMGYTPSMVFTQPPVERALRSRAAALEAVTVDLGVTLVSLAQDDGGVSLLMRADDGTERHVRARHVIGCDGASSTVRSLLGLPLDDLDFDEPWLVVDVLVNDAGLAKLPRTSVQYCEPDRPCSYLIGPGRHRRWEISLHEGEDPQQAATVQGAWQLLSRWLTPADGELWRQASYRFHALVATQWCEGRVFIAGDAAHQQPPFLGQGMCQGVRDVANLCWKLIAVHRGDVRAAAAPRLLASYGDERQQHVRELTSRIKAIGAVICERDVAQARARDLELLTACGGNVPDTPRQDVLPRLATGCLSEVASSARGTLFPQPSLADASAPGVLFDERAGNGWCLVVGAELGQGSVPAEIDGLLRVAVLDDPAWQETEQVLARWMQLHGCRAVLVRPDRYVFGVAGSAAELQALMSEWRLWFAP